MRSALLAVSLLWCALARVGAAEPEVVFEDSLKGKLGEGWTWLREHPEYRRITPQGLEIRVEPGVAGTVKNALVRPAPDRTKASFAVEVTGKPWMNTWWHIRGCAPASSSPATSNRRRTCSPSVSTKNIRQSMMSLKLFLVTGTSTSSKLW